MLHARSLLPLPCPKPLAPPKESPSIRGYRLRWLPSPLSLEAAEDRLTDLDSRAGDGDLGASMVRAAEALRMLAREPWSDPATLLTAIAGALRRAIGGSSGPFYATALLRAARRLPSSPTASDWAQAFEDAVAAIGDLGGAQPGDRTMIDALAPAARRGVAPGTRRRTAQ